MGNVAFDTTYKSIQGVMYRVKVYDHTGGLTAFTRTMSMHDLFINSRGDDRDVLNTIKPCRAGMKFYAEDAYTRAFKDALITSAEGRFYLEIRNDDDNQRLFFGRIIGNSYQQADESEPEVTIEAIDGLTILKSIDYLHPSVSGLANLKEIFTYIIGEIDVVDKYYISTDIVLLFSSTLNNKTGENLIQTTYHNDYFYREENGIKRNYNCYQVLEEILNRYNLRVHYQNGYYVVQGKETLFGTAPSFLTYDKSGVLQTTTVTQQTYDLLDDVTTRMLAGGTYYYEPGYKKTIINVLQYHLNKNLADGQYWYYSTTQYQEINTMIADTDYLAKIKINLALPATLIDPSIYYVMMRFHIKRVGETSTIYTYYDDDTPPFDHDIEINTSTTTLAPVHNTTVGYTDVLMPFKNLPLDCFLYVPFNQQSEEKVVSMRVELLNFYDGGNQIVTPLPSAYNCYTISMELGIEPIEKADKDIFFEAIANNSSETETKETLILACDQYGSALARAYIKGLSWAVFEVSENKWRFGTSGAYSPLERLIVKTLMGMLKNKQMFYQGSYYRKGNTPLLTDIIAYRDYNFTIASYTWNIIDEIVDVSMIKVGSIDTGVTVTETEPVLIPDFPSSEILDPLNPLGGIESHYEEWSGVNDEYVTGADDLELFFPDDAFKVKARCRVYVDGIKYRYVDYTTVSDPPTVGELQPNEYTYSITNNALYFPYAMSGAYVEFYYLKA
jgi:hypothetical protein